jgi:hypothetical protein
MEKRKKRKKGEKKRILEKKEKREKTVFSRILFFSPLPVFSGSKGFVQIKRSDP